MKAAFIDQLLFKRMENTIFPQKYQAQKDLSIPDWSYKT